MIVAFAPVIGPHDPNEIDWDHARRPPLGIRSGDSDRILGGDNLGRDILSSLTYGSRVSIIVSLGATSISILLGVSIGLLAGMRGGRTDRLAIALSNMMLSLPYLLFVIVIMGVLGPSLRNVILVFGVSDSPLFVRVARGETLILKASSFVLAARAIGASEQQIIIRHIVPNILNVVIVVATFEMAVMILYEAGLGFLGLSVPPDIPSWGNMLAEARQYLSTAWWLSTFPG